MQKTTLTIIAWRALVACLLLAIPGYLLYRHLHPASTLDLAMQKTVANASKVDVYTQTIETSTSFPDRLLSIVGTYYVDNKNKEYVSYSTTTLFISGDKKGHSFTYADIAQDKNVFYKITTADTILKKAIKASPDWMQFKNDSIPADKADLAIAGPVQDNLTILSNNGSYLTLVKKVGDVTWGTEQLQRYTFTLSSKAFALPDGPLTVIAGRLGLSGTVDVWIDPTTFTVKHLLFQNAPYYSTTTITNIGVRSPVTPPAGGQVPQ